jgi:ribosomal protein S19E (S16A)
MILEVLGIILLVFIFMLIGYYFALSFWSVKELIKSSKENLKLNEQLTKINQHQVEQINIANETIKKNRDWYIIQLRTIGNYINEKYSDIIINSQLNAMLGSNLEQAQFVEEKHKEYNIDDLLDKINEYGIDSLTLDELDFLKGDLD